MQSDPKLIKEDVIMPVIVMLVVIDDGDKLMFS